MGDAPWGTHFCQFYRTPQDLADVVVPYLKAGLEQDELCMWVTSEPLGTEDAWAALAAAVPDLDTHRRRERIKVVPYTEWYLAGGRFDARRVLSGWVRELEAGTARGCAGLRLTGNTLWLEPGTWKEFKEYEAAVDEVIGKYRMLVLCTYSLDRCGASEIIDVVGNHEFGLIKRDGSWEVIESRGRRWKREAEEARAGRDSAEQALIEANRRKDEFLAVLSHELRNPLMPIRNSLFLLEKAPPGSDPSRRAREVMGRQIDHLSRIVDDLLDVTRIARGKTELRFSRVDLAAVVRRAVDDHLAAFTAAGITVELLAPAGPLWVWADETRLAQVAANLLDNAGKFTPRGGRIVVEPAAEAQCAVLRVRDTGLGIGADMLARIFEPFAQADRTLERSRGGLGLGLALVKGLVELHGGTVAAESDGPDRGAEFTVRLPLHGATASLGGDGARGSTAPRRCVLVVEDDEDAAESLKDVLTIMGHEVRVAHDGPRAIAEARAFNPEVVLCDIGLPGMDGHEVARTLRRDRASPGPFLVALTGYARDQDRQRATESGFDRLLPKPATLEALSEVLRQASSPATSSDRTSR